MPFGASLRRIRCPRSPRASPHAAPGRPGRYGTNAKGRNREALRLPHLPLLTAGDG